MSSYFIGLFYSLIFFYFLPVQMAPPRKIIKRQLEILVDYLEENKDISGGTPFSPIGLHAAKVKWTIVAKKLNAVENGAQKSPDGWKKVCLCNK